MLLFNIFELLTRYQVKNQIGTTRFSGSFVRMNQILVCTYITTPTQSTSLGFCLQVFRPAGPPQQLWTVWQEWEICVRSLFHGHNDTLPVRKSNQSQQPLLDAQPLSIATAFSCQNI